MCVNNLHKVVPESKTSESQGVWILVSPLPGRGETYDLATYDDDYYYYYYAVFNAPYVCQSMTKSQAMVRDHWLQFAVMG